MSRAHSCPAGRIKLRGQWQGCHLRFIYMHVCIYNIYICVASNKNSTRCFWINSSRSWTVLLEPIWTLYPLHFLSPLPQAEATSGWVCGLQSTAVQWLLKNCTWSNSSFCSSNIVYPAFPDACACTSGTQKELTTVWKLNSSSGKCNWRSAAPLQLGNRTQPIWR